uniref:ABC transporter I family member 10, chloroplastic-like n=1 Tax=Tanacetum cinerariifolium TaxID=118510 RepID=A0A6L2MRS5_TANCI|nr:ABC transporter I family member 10, chloroplastic-like [Tanacetum cinerariifolium]
MLRVLIFILLMISNYVVMPTVEADVAFGLGRFKLTNDETKLRVIKALTVVGMYDYLQTTSQYPAPSTTYPNNLPLPLGLSFNWAWTRRLRFYQESDKLNALQTTFRPVQTLSGGQKQRVAIFGALVEDCKVLLLDELTTFCDETDQILPRIVLEAIPLDFLKKERAKILDQHFDISLSFLRPAASSYTTPIESSYFALSSLWDNVVLAYEPV